MSEPTASGSFAHRFGSGEAEALHGLAVLADILHDHLQARQLLPFLEQRARLGDGQVQDLRDRVPGDRAGVRLLVEAAAARTRNDGALASAVPYPTTAMPPDLRNTASSAS